MQRTPRSRLGRILNVIGAGSLIRNVRCMKHPIKYALIAVGGALIVGVAIVVGFSLWLTRASIDQSKGPTSRDEALDHCSIPLPPSAHNVQYASYAAGLQEGH